MSLRARTFVVGIASGVIGVLLMFAATRLFNRGVVASDDGPPMDWVLSARERERCEAAPEAWHIDGPPGVRSYAYDLAQRRSHNPDAPVLGPGAWDALDHGVVVVDIYGLGNGGVYAMKIADHGSCAVLAAPWPAFYSRTRIRLTLLICGFLAAVAGAAAGSLGVVRPLVQRLARVRRAAAEVGAAAGYASTDAGAADDLGGLARELDRAHARIRADAEQLETQHHALQAHIHDVAHDLRTPIASLQLALQEAASAHRDPALVRAIHDVVYINGLIGNLRLASELRDGWTPATRGSVVLGDALERAVLRVQFLAKQKGIELHLSIADEPVTVTGDPIAVEQAVANVIENAVAHNLPDRHAAVLLQIDGDEFVVTVVDDGPGVEPTELPRLGERTFRTDAARERDKRGSGLGLAITAEVCTRLGWRLGFAREEPVGLRVTIRGPR